MNTERAITIIEHLARAARHAVICPGSRSTPLALAAAAHPHLSTHVGIDERSAAYFALGLAKTDGPTIILTTSGTAVANLLPAVIEAHQDNVPLVVLTADRPPRLRDTGANQTIDQVGIFSKYVRYEVDLIEGTQMHLDTLHERPGPIHINVAFDKPLEPDAAGRAAIDALRASDPPRWTPPPQVPRKAPDIDPCFHGTHGIIVCGPTRDPVLRKFLPRVARHLGVPLIADGLSGLRDGEAIASYDLYLGDADVCAQARPDWVLQFGMTPTSRHLRSFLADTVRYKLDASGRDWDDIPGEVTQIRCDAESWCKHLLKLPSPDKDLRWHALWDALEHHAQAATRQALDKQPDVEAAWVAPVVATGARIFVGNSMPVRDLDRFADHIPDVHANRGASGIDGTMATAAGVARRPTIAVIGDVSAQHDLGSLAWLHEDLRLIIIANGGGRIFHHLPISQSPEFDRLFLTPPAVDFVKAAQAFGHRVTMTRPSGLAEALADDVPIIVVHADGAGSAAWRQALETAVHQELAGVIATTKAS